MTTQANLGRGAADALLKLPAGRAMPLGRGGGELTVLEGRVWLTRDGDPDDLCVRAGERLRLAAGETVVIEPWDAGHTAIVRWRPRGPGFLGGRLAQALRGLVMPRSALE